MYMLNDCERHALVAETPCSFRLRYDSTSALSRMGHTIAHEAGI